MDDIEPFSSGKDGAILICTALLTSPLQLDCLPLASQTLRAMPCEMHTHLAGEGQDLQKAKRIVKAIAQGCENPSGFDHFSVSPYDTAWVSMVSKPKIDGSRQWLFPESFAFVLGEQSSDGSWRQKDASPVDDILNTMGGLLAMLVHLSTDQTGIHGQVSQAIQYDSRISKAKAALSHTLYEWNVNATVHVGFELLVPSLLHQLPRYGFVFEFPGKFQLMKLNEQKLLGFRPGMVTPVNQTTLLHSLEGLIGLVDFDQLAHHCTAYGGLLGSPSSTAAYLIHSKNWDDAVEQYLSNVVQSYGLSGVPSAFPTPVFETTWIIRTLLTNYNVDEFPRNQLITIHAYLERILDKQQGSLGFAPGFLADANDISMTLCALASLGADVDVSSLISKFEAPSHSKHMNWSETQASAQIPTFCLRF